MAKTGDIIEHPVTGETIVFRKTAADTGGELLQLEFTMRPHGFVAAQHIHPQQEERFQIISGSVKFRVNSVVREAHAGETLTVPAGTPHVWWNDADQEAQVLVDLRPALRSEEFFETFFGLAQDGKVNPKTGMPSLLALALILQEFNQEVCLPQPPMPVQKVLFSVLGSVGRLRGYEGHYQYPR